MKRLFSSGPRKTELRDVEMTKITDPGQVLIKVKYNGVCMSEHYDWETGVVGQTFGHEPVGTIVEVGSAVKDYKVGDRVGGMFDGSVEYSCAEPKYIVHLPDNVSDEDAILEPLTCLISAVSKVKIPVIGDKVAIVGCGYMGCGAISLLKKRGAYVVAVDIRPECLEFAKRYGADEVYTPDQLPEHYFDIPGKDLLFSTQGAGFKLVMEWGETNESLDLAVRMTRQCGQLAVGAYHTGEKRAIDLQMLGAKAIDLLNTHPREMDINIVACNNAIRMLGDGSWDFKGLPTKVYPVTQFDRAHEELKDKYGKWMKAIIDWEMTEGEPYIINN